MISVVHLTGPADAPEALWASSAEGLRAQGYAVTSPAESGIADTPTPLVAIASAILDADAVVVLPGEISSGLDAELMFAKTLGKPIFDLDEIALF